MRRKPSAFKDEEPQNKNYKQIDELLLESDEESFTSQPKNFLIENEELACQN